MEEKHLGDRHFTGIRKEFLDMKYTAGVRLVHEHFCYNISGVVNLPILLARYLG